MGYREDIVLEKKFATKIKQILGCIFITQDPIKDKEEGTDFLIFEVHPFSIGVRLRRFINKQNIVQFYKYRHEFTIRWSRPSGIETEIDKIRKGYVRYFMYGWVDRNEEKIIQYFIGDLDVFRKREPKPIAIRVNNPPDSELAIYRIDSLPKEFYLAFFIDKSITKEKVDRFYLKNK